MKIKTAKYLKSCFSYKECPKPIKPEFAFTGRSNVGKSSLINMLVNVKNLAHTSSKPGKTKTINFFSINDRWFLVDLPGYGYAKLNKDKKKFFGKLITEYLLNRPNLLYIFVLVDSTIEPQQKDLNFMYNLTEAGLPFAIIFTKTDKITANKLNQFLSKFKKQFLEIWEQMPPYFTTSAIKNIGREEILNFISETIDKYWDNKKIIPNLY